MSRRFEFCSATEEELETLDRELDDYPAGQAVYVMRKSLS